MRDATTYLRPPMALVASDQVWSIRSVENILAPNGYAMLRAASGDQALERALSAQPDIIVIDFNLPDMLGAELCHRLRREPRIPPSTPILIATPTAPTRRQRLEALRAGAWDLIGFPLDADEFLLKVHTYVRAKSDADRAREASLLDELSGLYNARGILRRARELGSYASRHHTPLACVVFAPDVELDGSDDLTPAVASHLARVLKQSGRTSDAIGRLGGTEFIVVALATDKGGTLRLAHRLLQAMERAREKGAEHLPPFTMRAGCYAVPDFRTASMDPADLLLRATKALRDSQAAASPERIRFFHGESALA